MKSEEDMKKGGRIAKTNAEYFTLPGHRTDELKAIKLIKGSVGVDIYLTIYEKICVSEYFIWDFGKNYKLTVFSDENNFDPDIFSEILKYMVVELQLFDHELYLSGFLFSRQFVNQFHCAGLFGQRTIKASDIYKFADNLRVVKGDDLNNKEEELPF